MLIPAVETRPEDLAIGRTLGLFHRAPFTFWHFAALSRGFASNENIEARFERRYVSRRREVFEAPLNSQKILALPREFARALAAQAQMKPHLAHFGGREFAVNVVIQTREGFVTAKNRKAQQLHLSHSSSALEETPFFLKRKWGKMFPVSTDNLAERAV